MNLTEQLEKYSYNDCQIVRSHISNFNDDQILGELRIALTDRMDHLNSLREAEETALLNKLEGKCFKIIYAPDHIVLLKVNSVTNLGKNEYGVTDANIQGEQIIRSVDAFEYTDVDEKSARHSTYFKSNGIWSEYDIVKFDEIREKLLSIEV